MQIRRLVTGLTAAAALLVMSGTVASANHGSVINFEGLSEGAIVGTLSPGGGITVAVNSSPIAGRDMIFDADCADAGCSGGDADLSAPAQGNILIYSADGDSRDPDDSDVRGSTLSFVFSDPVTLESAWVIDTEEGVLLRLFSDAAGNNQIGGAIAGPVLANGASTTFNFPDTAGVVRADFIFGGSGGLDDIKFFVPPPPPNGGGEGCTPGYWKNHTDRWQGFTTGQRFDAVFGVDGTGNPTLLQALNTGGGGEIAFQRHAVAALLNAQHGGVDSGQSVADVIAIVRDAYRTGDFGDAKDILEDVNEQGCPLGGTSATTGGGNSNANSRRN